MSGKLPTLALRTPASVTPRRVHGDRVQSTYLGFGLDISQSRIQVSTPAGRWIGEERTLSGARRLIRGYRRASSPVHASVQS